MEKITPTVPMPLWSDELPVLLDALRGKRDAAAETAVAELWRMAEAADRYNRLVLEHECLKEANVAIAEASR